jgi:hypothetical protein
MVHVGFYDYALGIGELYANFLVAAPDVASAKNMVKNKPEVLEKHMHIDGIQEINQIDGYQIILDNSKSETIPENIIHKYKEIQAL